MRALADYVMRGRTEAVIAAVLTTGTVLFAWVGAAIVALVTLRKGPSQGSKVLVWAMIPAIALAVLGDTGPMTTLLGAALAATVLRATASWQWTLVAAVVSAAITALLMHTIGRAYLEQVLQVLTEAMSQVNSPQGSTEGLRLPSVVQVAGLLGLSNGLMVIVCLLLARWWQAVLYNPGGFRQEFHRLRLAPPLTVCLLLLGLAVSLLGPDYKLWAMIFALPLVFAGFALVHGLVALKGLNSAWLGGFYFLWLVLGPVKMLTILLAVIDSWVDIRARTGRVGSE